MDTSQRRLTGLLAMVFFFFFVSGACGLLYQVVWTRKLVLIFGTTSYAVSTVLSIFFLGLSIGSFWGGRLADRVERRLRLYGYMEIAIGVWAMLFILFIDAGEGVVVSILREVGGSRLASIGFRGVFAAGLLIVPVVLMGATLPLLSRTVTTSPSVKGLRIGSLYSLNTFGAVLGCAVTGFVLLAEFGYKRTTVVGAVLNVAIGVLAILISSRVDGAHEVEASEDLEEPAHRAQAGDPGVGVLSVVFIAFAASGFSALALEVIWTRLLAVLFTGTTYAFTTMLTTVLCGIALGSALASAFIDRVRNHVGLYGVVQILTGLACLWMLWVFPTLPARFAEYRLQTGYDWDRLVFWKFVVCFLALLPPTLLFGMSFPFAVKAVSATRENVGRMVGRLYSVNTIGGVAGSLVGGFLLIPVVGAHQGIVVLSLLLVCTGVLLVLSAPGAAIARRGLTAAVGVIVAVAMTLQLPEDVSRSMNSSFLPEDHETIHYAEGVEGTVVVSGPVGDTTGSERVLWINGVQATASIDKGVKMNRFEASLPMMLGRDFDRALFMCFGSGITAGALSLLPYERIDAVEISDEVLEAARHFRADNFDVTENPKMNFIVDDGRNYLLMTEARYDLISFEPMPLALAGVSTFYTYEYYELCARALKPGGLVQQWIPLHAGLHADIVKDLVKTFISVFPNSTAWFINADLFLIGSNEELRIDYARLQARWDENPRLREALKEVYLGDVTELLASHLMNKDGLRWYAGKSRVMMDDRPWAEFLAPKMMYRPRVAESVEDFEAYVDPPGELIDYSGAADTEAGREAIRKAVERRHAAHRRDLQGLKKFYGGGPFSDPEKEFREALAIDPLDFNARYYLSQVLLMKGDISIRWEELDKAVAQLMEAREVAPHRGDVHLALGDAYYERGDTAAAAESYARYLELGGSEARARVRSASWDR